MFGICYHENMENIKLNHITWITGFKRSVVSIFLIHSLLLPSLSFGVEQDPVTLGKNEPVVIKKQGKLGDASLATFLFVAGSWLAWKQLPRLAGQQVELNNPQFTKIGASILMAIGVVGGTFGAGWLCTLVRDTLNA